MMNLPCLPAASSPELRRRIREMAEPSLADFSSSLVPGLARPMLGVRIPRLRQLARELARGDWRRTLAEDLGTETFEEVMLHGFVTGYARMEPAELLARIEAFIPLADNWAVCDCCCSTFTAVRRCRETAWPLLATCLRSREEFRQRFGAVMLMDHYLADGYAERVLEALAALQPVGYYAAMGGGWALSVAFVKFPQATLDLLRRPDVDADLRRLACRKILESRRTAPELRSVIRQLKSEI